MLRGRHHERYIFEAYTVQEVLVWCSSRHGQQARRRGDSLPESTNAPTAFTPSLDLARTKITESLPRVQGMLLAFSCCLPTFTTTMSRVDASFPAPWGYFTDQRHGRAKATQQQLLSFQALLHCRHFNKTIVSGEKKWLALQPTAYRRRNEIAQAGVPAPGGRSARVVPLIPPLTSVLELIATA